jgi:hypothetical protein
MTVLLENAGNGRRHRKPPIVGVGGTTFNAFGAAEP